MTLVPFVYTWRSLFVRRGSTLLTVISIGATVAVLSAVRPQTIGIGVGLALGLGLVAGIVPAIGAARMRPVEALRAT